MYRNPELAWWEREWGVSMDGMPFRDYLKPDWKKNVQLAMDAQPSLVTTPNSAIPVVLTTYLDPDLLKVLTAKNAAAMIFGEERKGSFLDTNVIFPVIEYTGEVSSYGDFNNNGSAGANLNFPEREPYNYQTIVQYGQVEMEKAGLAKVGWAAALQTAAVIVLNKFQNLTYFYGVSGLANYGILNDPALNAPIAPGPKAAGGQSWWTGNILNATANEIYADIQAMFRLLVSQSSGNIDAKSPMVLCLSPSSEAALTATNSFNVNVADLIKKNFPSLRIQSAIQYGVLSAQNPQGSAAGETMQLIAETVEGQKTGLVAFNEKLRGGPVILGLSSFSQKLAQGSLGAVIKQPFAIAGMVGI